MWRDQSVKMVHHGLLLRLLPTFRNRTIWLVSIFSILMSQASMWYWSDRFTQSLLQQEFIANHPILSIQQRASGSPPFRMLLGIFTINTVDGKQRRDVIRRTYLSLPQFLESHNITTVPKRHARICSLDDYWYQKISDPEQCQLLYTFVMGAVKDPKAPVEYLNLEPDRPMTVNISTIPDAEPDVTYLNIRENMNYGKSNTWFKYASNILPESLQIDLIAKVDTDCVVHPTILLKELEERISVINMMYGGSEIHNDKGHHYMQGGFYFLSRSLADKTTTGSLNRWKIIREFMQSYRLQRPEDVETGQLVKHYGGDDVERIDIRENFAYVHNKKIKLEQYFLEYWNRYCDDLIAQDFMVRVITKHKTNCPSAAILAEEKSTLSNVSASVLKRVDELITELVDECEFFAHVKNS